VPPRGTAAEKDVAVATFLTGGQIRPQGQDVMVTGDGKRTGTKVLATGPGDFCRVAFEVARGVSEYYVYYGNPAAVNPYHWEPPVGLWLETRRYNGGDPNDLTLMKRIARGSGPSFGGDFVPSIFQGYNLFGPNEDFVSLYQGQMMIEKAGDYAFATSSDDASFFLIDGALVAQKPGWGGAVNVPTFAGASHYLAQGPHAVEYYHVQGKATAIAAAYWRRPADKYFSVLPPAVFPVPLRVEAGPVEWRGLEAAPDMALAEQGLLWLDNALIGRLTLSNRSRLPEGQDARLLWDFGDGVTSTERDPQHVYLHSGEVTVTLTLQSGGRTLSTQQRFLIGPGWPCQLGSQETDEPKYAAIAAACDPEKLAASDLVTGLDLFQDTGRGKDILRWSAALFLSDKRNQLSEAQWMRYGPLYATLLRENELAKESVQLLTLCLTAVKAPMGRGRLLLMRGDSKLDYLRLPDDAAEDYLAVLRLQGSSKDDLFRQAQIRLGDVARQKGQLDAARAEYDKALAMRPAQTGLDSAVKLGAYQQSIEQYMLNGELDTAEALIDTWEWERPHVKLDGMTTLLRARLAIERKQFSAAINEAEDLVRVNPASEQAPALLLIESDAWTALKEPEKAEDALTRLLGKYPEAPEQQDARRKMREIAK